MRAYGLFVPVLAALALAAVSLADSPASVGARDVKWTATTYEAAGTEAQKKMLASGKPASVTGEVVDVSCYLQLGKRGDAHVACGTKCITNGQPIGLLDDKGKLYILFAEQHHPRRDGEVTLKDTFLPLLAKRVTVNGMKTEVRGVHALFVEGFAAAAPGEKK